MKATIYIPDEKYPIYEKAKETLSDSISETFLRCLERELENRKLRSERIVVEVRDRDGRVTKKAFEGTWLVGSANNGEEFPEENRYRYSFSVAKTKQGRLAVIATNHHHDEDEFTVYDDFEEFKNADTGPSEHYPLYPAGLIAAVADALDIDHIEELDI